MIGGKSCMNNILSLAGSTALITGASSGLGRHFAHTLAAAGARVVVAARRTDKLAELIAELESSANVEAHAVELDVTQADSIKECFDSVGRLVGVADIIVNNAGITVTKPVLEQTEEDWDATMATNLRGAFLVAQEAARRLVEAGKGGSIINTASITALRPAGAVTSYAVSKAGLVHLTKTMALELARYNIRVNAMAPGYLSTDLNSDFLASDAGEKMRKRVPQRRFGNLTELDGPLLLLASEAGSYMTGSVVVVDGGHMLSTL